MNVEQAKKILAEDQGPPMVLMEVCGTHTAAIAKSGIRSLLPKHIRLVAGPGCPVCVSPASFVDALCAEAKGANTIIATFGDMLKVPGNHGSLALEKQRGADIRMIVSPMQALQMALEYPDHRIVLAAVGFETTAPSYALLVQRAKKMGIKNLVLHTALRLVPPALHALCVDKDSINGFLAPGHVSVIIGSDAYVPIAQQYQKPIVIGGFMDAPLFVSIARLVQMVRNQEGRVVNDYPLAVTSKGNIKAQELLTEVFDALPAYWRGIGEIPDSGLFLKDEYAEFRGQQVDFVDSLPKGCQCGQVLLGKLLPHECPLYQTRCTIDDPVGPCMVSEEGACGVFARFSAR